MGTIFRLPPQLFPRQIEYRLPEQNHRYRNVPFSAATTFLPRAVGMRARRADHMWVAATAVIAILPDQVQRDGRNL